MQLHFSYPSKVLTPERRGLAPQRSGLEILLKN
jgi:hypothetical protein